MFRLNSVERLSGGLSAGGPPPLDRRLSRFRLSQTASSTEALPLPPKESPPAPATAPATATAPASASTGDAPPPKRRLSIFSNSSRDSMWSALSHRVTGALAVAKKLQNCIGTRRMLKQSLTSDKTVVACCILDTTIVTAFEDGEVAFLDSTSLDIKSRLALPCNKEKIKGAAFSKNHQFLAFCLASNRLCVIRLSDGNLVNSLEMAVVDIALKKKSFARFVNWSHDDKWIMTGGEDNSARIFHAETLREDHCYSEMHKDNVVACDMSVDGRKFATGSKDKKLRIFDLDQSKMQLEYKCDRAYAVVFSPKGKYLAVGSDDSMIRIFDCEGFHLVHLISDHTSYVRALAFTPDDKAFYSGGKDGTLRKFDTDSAQQTLQINGLSSVAFITTNDNQNQIVAGYQLKDSTVTKSIIVLNMENTQVKQSVLAYKEKDAIQSVAFDPTGKPHLVVCCESNISVVNIATGATVSQSNDSLTGIACMCVSSCGSLVLIGDKQGNIKALESTDLTSVIKIATIDAAVSAIAYTSCGRYLAVGDVNGVLRIYSDEDALLFEFRECKKEIHSLSFSKCSCSLSGNCSAKLAAGSGDNCVRVFDLSHIESAGTEHRFLCATFSSHTKEVYGVAFSPDGLFLASCSRDKTSRVYSMETMTETAKLSGSLDHIKGISFTPDGSLVVTGLDQVLRCYPRSTDDGVVFTSSAFGCRTKTLSSEALCLSAAPPSGRYENLVAIGCKQGQLYFIDLSWNTQQPLFDEAVEVITRERESGRFLVTKEMVEKFPLCVHAKDQHGNTLCHYAVEQEDDRLLAVLLAANLKSFWFPMNDVGIDILALAVQLKARLCIKIILDKLIEAKHGGFLAPLPFRQDRFLHNILNITREFSDLIANFLHDFGLDESPREVLNGCELLTVRSEFKLLRGTDRRVPDSLWSNTINSVEDKGLIGIGGEGAQASRMAASFTSIPRMAGIITDSAIDRGVAQLRNTILHTFVNSDNAQLFGNVAMKNVLDYKWDMYAKNLFLRELGIFGIYLLLFTLFTTVVANDDFSLTMVESLETAWGFFGFSLCLVLPVLSARQVRRETRQLERSRDVKFYDDLQQGRSSIAWRKAITEHFTSGWNVLQMLTAITTILSCFLFTIRSSWVTSVTGISAFFMWINVLYFLRAFEFAGALVRMVFKVLYYSGPFMLILVIVLLGSSNCYYVLFSHAQDAEDPLFGSDDGLQGTVFKMFQMLLLGENGGMDIPGQPIIMVKGMFILLTLGVNVFMMNLMINLMDDHMAKINGEEGDAFPCEKAGIIADIELMMPEEMLQDKVLFPNWLHILAPRGGEHAGDDEWKGTVQAIRQENEKLERRSRQTLHDLGKKITDDMLVMEKRFESQFASMNERVSQRLESLTDSVAKLRVETGQLVKTLNPPSVPLASMSRVESSSFTGLRGIMTRSIRKRGSEDPQADTQDRPQAFEAIPEQSNADTTANCHTSKSTLTTKPTQDLHEDDSNASESTVVNKEPIPVIPRPSPSPLRRARLHETEASDRLMLDQKLEQQMKTIDQQQHQLQEMMQLVQQQQAQLLDQHRLVQLEREETRREQAEFLRLLKEFTPAQATSPSASRLNQHAVMSSLPDPRSVQPLIIPSIVVERQQNIEFVDGNTAVTDLAELPGEATTTII